MGDQFEITFKFILNPIGAVRYKGSLYLILVPVNA